MKSPDIPGLQTLRAVAALMVLVGHVLAEAGHYMGLTLPGQALPWTRGVDIFFVISGFVVTLSAHRFLGRPGAFLARRLLRVAPLYFLFTTLMVLVLLVFPSGTKDTGLDPGQILSSYLFFPFERADGRIAPVLSLGWTLNYEVFFYALLAFCLALTRPFVSIAVMILGLTSVGLLITFDNIALSFWTNPLIVEFLFGIALARLWQCGFHLPNRVLVFVFAGAGIVLLVVLHKTDLPRFLAAGIPATMIVAAGTLFCPLKATPMQLVGDASYALYLSHRFTLRGATLLLLPMFPATITGGVLYVGVVCCLATLVSVGVYVYIERPIMRAVSHPLRQTAQA